MVTAEARRVRRGCTYCSGAMVWILFTDWLMYFIKRNILSSVIRLL